MRSKTRRTNDNKSRLIILSANTAWNLGTRKRLIKGIMNAGWDVVTAASPDGQAAILERDTGASFRPIPMKSDGTSLFADIGTFLRFFTLYATTHPSIALHINNKPNIYGSIAAMLLGIPSISNVTGLGVVAEKRGMTKFLVYSLYRLAFRSPRSFVFFQNADDRRFFVENRLVAANRTAVIPGSGVDTERFVPIPLASTEHVVQRPVRFLFSGRLLVSKGIADFIEAARLVKAGYPETVFTVIGEHVPDNPIFIGHEDLQRAVSDGTIEYPGQVNDVLPMLHSSDCVVLPSYYREGVPRALLEAAAAGKPLIVADSVGTREPLEDGKNGYLVPPRDPRSLADAMIRFIELDETGVRRMGSESRRIACDRFSDSIVLGAYISAISNFRNPDREG